MKNWIIKLIVNRVIELALDKADVTPYVEAAADAVDTYLDKHIGETNSEKIQKAVVKWINKTVKAFTEKLDSN